MKDSARYYSYIHMVGFKKALGMPKPNSVTSSVDSIVQLPSQEFILQKMKECSQDKQLYYQISTGETASVTGLKETMIGKEFFC